MNCDPSKRLKLLVKMKDSKFMYTVSLPRLIGKKTKFGTIDKESKKNPSFPECVRFMKNAGFFPVLRFSVFFENCNGILSTPKNL